MVKKLQKSSNKARLDALNQRRSAQQKQADLIKHGLANATNSKKITFDSDSNSDGEIAPKLFKAESSDSDSDFFSAKPKKSEDSRFQLDEEPETTKCDMATEVSHTLSLLADITGDSAIYTNEQKDLKFSDPSHKRYDPSKLTAEPSGPELPDAPISVKKRKTEKIEDSSRFMNITGNLTSAFGAKKEISTNSGFSFDFSKPTEASNSEKQSRFGNLPDDEMSISSESSSSESASSTDSEKELTTSLAEKNKLNLNLPTEKTETERESEFINGIEYPKMPNWPLSYPIPPSKFESKEEKKQHLFNLLKKRLNNFKKSQLS